MSKKEALGVDIGGVIIPRMSGRGDTSFSGSGYLETPPVAGTFEGLRELVDQRFDNRVYLVSKCGPRVRTKTLRWLKHQRFYEITGIKSKNIHFCMERKNKGPICAKLGITHFIDDHLDVLLNLHTVPNRYLLQCAGSSQIPPYIQVVRSWQEIRNLLLERAPGL